MLCNYIYASIIPLPGGLFGGVGNKLGKASLMDEDCVEDGSTSADELGVNGRITVVGLTQRLPSRNQV